VTLPILALFVVATSHVKNYMAFDFKKLLLVLIVTGRGIV